MKNIYALGKIMGKIWCGFLGYHGSPIRMWYVKTVMPEANQHYVKGQRVLAQMGKCKVCHTEHIIGYQALCEWTFTNGKQCQNTSDGYCFVPKLKKTLWLCPGCWRLGFIEANNGRTPEEVFTNDKFSLKELWDKVGGSDA